MTVVPPQQVQIKCPNCGQPFRTVIFSMIDVGQQPELKGALLTGQLNVAVCPNCGAGSLIGAPLIYHDPEKQLFLAYFPQELNARPDDQERFIGEMASIAMRGLPAEIPKGYLLNPRRFLTLQSLLDTVLEAEGISREQIDQQRRRVNLIGRLADALEDDAQFARVVEESRDQIDYDLLALISAYIDASSRDGRSESVEMLQLLRDRLVAQTGIAAPEAELDEIEEEPDLEALVERVLTADASELPAILGEARADIDYAFFEQLTGRIDAATRTGDQAMAERLAERRQLVLETVERLDREAQELFEGATTVLREVLGAEDRLAVLRQQRERIDDAFLLVLEANIAGAERAGNGQLAAEIDTIRSLALQVVEEALTPQDRLINQLLQAETPQQSTKLLRQNATMVTPDFVKRLNELADDLEAAGKEEPSEQVRRLAREAGAMLF